MDTIVVDTYAYNFIDCVNYKKIESNIKKDFSFIRKYCYDKNIDIIQFINRFCIEASRRGDLDNLLIINKLIPDYVIDNYVIVVALYHQHIHILEYFLQINYDFSENVVFFDKEISLKFLCDNTKFVKKKYNDVAIKEVLHTFGNINSLKILHRNNFLLPLIKYSDIFLFIKSTKRSIYTNIKLFEKYYKCLLYAYNIKCIFDKKALEIVMNIRNACKKIVQTLILLDLFKKLDENSSIIILQKIFPLSEYIII